MSDPMLDPMLNRIAATLEEFPLCRKIIHFLIQNENAMDTARGIAVCWVQNDEVAVHSALDQLIMCGAVRAYTLRSGTIYGLTRTQSVRGWLRTAAGLAATRGDGVPAEH
jgi:hypothetical protein